MCKLDLIAGDGPVYHTQGELWLRWFFKNIQEADFVVALVIFGAVFLMVLSVITLFVVMLLKDRLPKKEKLADEGNGSVHFIPLLISIAASAMLFIGLIISLVSLVMQMPHLGLYHYFILPYDTVLIYIGIMAVLFELVLRFSPQGSKLFLGWNRICRNICLAVLIPGLLLIAFLCCFYWFSLLE